MTGGDNDEKDCWRQTFINVKMKKLIFKIFSHTRKKKTRRDIFGQLFAIMEEHETYNPEGGRPLRDDDGF